MITKNTFWNKYLNLWKELQGWQLFLFYAVHYTIIFFLIWNFAYAAFDEAGKTYIWTADGMPNYFSRLVYISKTIREGIQSLLAGNGWNIPLYDFALGPQKLDLQVEPVQWLAIFWPWDQIDVLYDILVIFRYYIAGLAFSIMGLYFRQKPFSILLGALSYCFCGFMLYAGVRHPFFIAPVIYLPLLVIGLEQVSQKKKPYLLIVIVFLAITSSLYFACMLAILSILYVVVRFPAIYKENRLKEFGSMLIRMVSGGGIGILLSGIILVPTLLQMLGTGRIGDSVYADFWVYPETYYQRLVAWFAVIPTSKYWTLLGFSIVSIPCVFLLFIRRNRKESSLRQLFIILMLMLMIPAVAYVMSGFNAISNRWCFAVALCVSAIIMFMTPHLLEITQKEFSIIAVLSIIYFCICYYVVDSNYYSKDAIVMLGVTLLLLALGIGRKENKETFMRGVTLGLVCLSVLYSADFRYSPDEGNYVAEFTDKGAPYDIVQNGQYASLAKSDVVALDREVFKVSGDNIIREELNSSYYSGLSGTSYYSSFQYLNSVKLFRELEMNATGNLIIWHGVKSDPAILSLDNVKYYAVRDASGEALPYGFTEVDRIKYDNGEDLILENENFLPIGYTYENYLPKSEYDNLNAMDKRQAMLQAVVLDEENQPTSEIQQKVTEELDLTAQELPAEITHMENVTWEDGKLKVTESNATVTITFRGVPDAITFLRIVNLDLTDGDSTRNWMLTVETENNKTQGRFIADAYTYSNDMKTQLLYLGCFGDENATCTITFPQEGTFILDDLQIWAQPMENYTDHISALKDESLQNVQKNWRGLTGTISTSKDKILCFALPYDKGWTAYVDGEKTALMQANTAYMALELPEGDHVVELRYWTPGLTVGIIATFFGIACFVMIIIYNRNRERKKEKF